MCRSLEVPCNGYYARWNRLKKVNLKAIVRIMRTYDLLSQIRRHRPYVHYKQAVHKYPNLLQRTFEQPLPNRFWVTDITYIPTTKGMLYLLGKAFLNSLDCKVWDTSSGFGLCKAEFYCFRQMVIGPHGFYVPTLGMNIRAKNEGCVAVGPVELIIVNQDCIADTLLCSRNLTLNFPFGNRDRKSVV